MTVWEKVRDCFDVLLAFKSQLNRIERKQDLIIDGQAANEVIFEKAVRAEDAHLTKQDATLQQILTAVQSDEPGPATSLVLTLGTPGPQ